MSADSTEDFAFGDSEYERVVISLLPVGGARIVVNAGAFHGRIDTGPLELKGLLANLRELHAKLEGEVQFNTLEWWNSDEGAHLDLQLIGDGTGRISVIGLLQDGGWPVANRLQFRLKFDQSKLAASIRDLGHIMSERSR